MFNLADYEPVEKRLGYKPDAKSFWEDYPGGRVETDLVICEKDRYVFKAYLFKDIKDDIAFATGHAEETVSSRGVNQTSALENCETSAIGRALANAGYAPKGKRPSREEMTKVIKTPAPTVEKDYWTTPFGEQEESIKKVPAPSTMDQAVNTVAEILGTEKLLPSCKHGEMKLNTGNKNGREWGGYFCKHIGVGGSEPKCPTIWAQVTSSGTWEPQKARA
jgi:hypothetical protein